MPSKKVYSCSMPNQVSKSAYRSAASAQAALVLEGWGDMSGSSTSHITNLLSPPRMGSPQLYTGLRTQSELSPVAWLVLEPSKPQMGSSLLFATTMHLERSLDVGCPPSIQMYSAL